MTATIADLERELAWTIAEGGDCTDLHHQIATARQIDTANLAGAVAQAIGDREHPGARTQPRGFYLTATAAYDWDTDEWAVDIRAGRRRYQLTTPTGGATRWVLFCGDQTRGHAVAGTRRSDVGGVAEWAIACVVSDVNRHAA